MPATGAFGSVAFVIFRPSSATTSILPAPSTRRSAGFASAPVPRMTEMYAFFGLRVHGEIGDLDLLHVRAEHRGNLLIDARDVLRPGRAAGGLLAEVDREDRRRLTVSREEHPVRPERQRPDRLKRRRRGRLCRRRSPSVLRPAATASPRLATATVNSPVFKEIKRMHSPPVYRTP